MAVTSNSEFAKRMTLLARPAEPFRSTAASDPDGDRIEFVAKPDASLKAPRGLGTRKTQESRVMKPGLWKTIWRSSRLRCPACGAGQVAKNWRETHETCASCGLDFRVEGGFYLGAIYFNYGVIALFLLGVGIPLVWFGYLSPLAATISGAAVCVAASLWFWRYARSLWLGFGYYIDHNVRAGKKETRSDAEVKARQQTYEQPGEESLDGICCFCHSRFRFARSRLSAWVPCPFCQEKILLSSVPEAVREDELSEGRGAGDPCTESEIAHSDATAHTD